MRKIPDEILNPARLILAVGILTVSSIFVGGCGTLAVVSILAQAIDKDTESTLIDAENRGLTGYITGSELDKERQARVKRQARVDKKYNKLIQMNDEEEIKREIGRFGDYEFGDKNGRPDPVEIDKAYQGFLKRWKSERFKRDLRKRPFIQILEGYKGY